MSDWVIVLLFSAGAVLLFVVGMSLTLMIKGHHIDSEIATNRHMRERGITCAAHDAHTAQTKKSKDCLPAAADCADTPCASCASCDPRTLIA